MKLTVGPLPPAVYWRRRAVLLAAVLVVVLLIAYSCSGDSGEGAKKGADKGGPSGSAAQTSTPVPSVLTPTGPEPSYTPPVYGAGSTGGSGNGGASGGEVPGAGNGELCADSEIAVVPTVENPTVRRGVATKLFIRIKNVSPRTCTRDVGAQMQELYMQQGDTRQWSSDACEDRGNVPNLVAFPPGHEESYWLTWDGKSNVRGCDTANQSLLPAGSYQLFGRLGTKVSAPVTFTVTA